MGTSVLPYGLEINHTGKAKQTIDNRLAGRAAKGATLVACSKKRRASARSLSFFIQGALATCMVSNDTLVVNCLAVMKADSFAKL